MFDDYAFCKHCWNVFPFKSSGDSKDFFTCPECSTHYTVIRIPGKHILFSMDTELPQGTLYVPEYTWSGPGKDDKQG